MTRGPSPRRFNSRAFVSDAMALAAAALPVTGLANHLLQTEPMNAARHAWMSAHTSLGVVFVVFAAWHVVLNRRALAGQFRGVLAQVPAAARELLYALVIVGGTTFLIVSHAFHAQ